MAEARLIKEFFARIGLWMVNSSGIDVALLAETDGTARVQPILYHSGTTQIRQKAETDGTATASLYGKDSGGNIDPLRTNADQQLQVEGVFSEGSAVFKRLGTSEPAATTETELYACPASTVCIVDRIVVANRSSTATTFNVGISAGGGALADEDHFFDTVAVDPRTTVMIDGPFYMAATDSLRVESAGGDVAFNAYGREIA